MDAVRIDEFQERVVQDHIYKADFEESRVEYSSSLVLWDGLITEPLNQIAAFQHSGVAEKDVANFVLNAAGFSAIAWRTGK